MADFSFDFDANSIHVEQREPTQGDFQLIPHGTKCWFELIEADIVPTSKGGQQLTYTAEIKAPEEYERRKIWGRVNISCPSSQKAEQIGIGELAALCKAIGIARPSDTNELLGQPFEGTIGIKREKGLNPTTGQPKKPKNVIGYYKPADGASSQQAAAKPAPRPAPTPAPAAKKKPWEVAA